MNKKRTYKKFAIVLVIMVVALFLGKKKIDNYKQRKQFNKVKNALYLLSFNLNRGNDGIYEVSNNLLKGSDALSQLDTYEITANKVIQKINN